MKTKWLILLLSSMAVACSPPETPVPPADRLLSAVKVDSTPEVLKLLTDGVDPNTISTGGELPLNSAARMGAEDLVAELLTSGANPVMEDSSGQHAFDAAIEVGNEGIVDEFILEVVRLAGGGPRVIDWMSAAAGDPISRPPDWQEVLNGELLSLGLMYAALHNQGNLIGQLRRAREIPNRTGYNALAVAARFGKQDAVRALLAIGVHPGIAASRPNRWTPLQLATMGRHQQVVALLKRAGARS